MSIYTEQGTVMTPNLMPQRSPSIVHTATVLSTHDPLTYTIADALADAGVTVTLAEVR